MITGEGVRQCLGCAFLGDQAHKYSIEANRNRRKILAQELRISRLLAQVKRLTRAKGKAKR